MRTRALLVGLGIGFSLGFGLGMLLGLSAMPAHAQELRSFQAESDFSAGWSINSDNIMQSIVETTPQWDIDVGDTLSLRFSTRFRLDFSEDLEPGSLVTSGYAPASRPATIGSLGTAELRDVYLERRFASGLLRLGKQQTVWGRLDGIKVLDVVNPQSFREFILDDFADSRISQWTAYADLLLADWRLELALIPDYTAHEIPRADAWYAFAAPRFRFGAAPGVPVPEQRTEDGRDAINDGAIGLRVSRSIGRWDVSGVAYSGNDHEPLGRIVPGEQAPLLERYYERRDLLGLSAASSFGAVVFRAEAAYQPDRVFNTRSSAGLRAAAADQVQLGLAADIDAPFGIFMNLQFLWDEIRDAPADLIRPDRDRVATVFLRRGFAYETLRLQARWYHSLDDGDDLIGARLEYDLDDDTTVYLSGDWFSGTQRGLFGQFSQRDRVVIGLRHTF